MWWKFDWTLRDTVELSSILFVLLGIAYFDPPREVRWMAYGWLVVAAVFETIREYVRGLMERPSGPAYDVIHGGLVQDCPHCTRKMPLCQVKRES